MMQNPLVSFVILAYNQEQFISEAIIGALSQTYNNMEIIVSDDCSTDNTYEIARQTIEKYNGDKKIYLYRNEKNMGLVPHVNKVVSEYSKGNYIALAGGDDISLSERIEKTVDLLKDENVYAVCGQYYLINRQGDIIGEKSVNSLSFCEINDEYIRDLSFMTGGAGLTIKRIVWDMFGDLELQTPAEDSTLRFRSLLMGKIAVSNDYFIKYRRHDNNLSNHVYFLKTKYIARQYLIDVKKAYKKQLIGKNLLKRLKRKIYIYYLHRKLSEIKSGKSIFIRTPLRLIQEVCSRMIYWI